MDYNTSTTSYFKLPSSYRISTHCAHIHHRHNKHDNFASKLTGDVICLYTHGLVAVSARPIRARRSPYRRNEELISPLFTFASSSQRAHIGARNMRIGSSTMEWLINDKQTASFDDLEPEENLLTFIRNDFGIDAVPIFHEKLASLGFVRRTVGAIKRIPHQRVVLSKCPELGIISR